VVETKKKPLYILYIIYTGSGSSRFTRVVKGENGISFKGASVFRACESHCPTVLSHNDYLAQSVPNYMYV